MKNLIASPTLAVTLGSLLLSIQPDFAQGTAFTYQGRLNDGVNLANGNYDLRFAIYDALTEGTQQGSLLTNSATAVSNGLFTVTLDFGNQYPGPVRWLEIGVRSNGAPSFFTLSPRQALTPAPYAITAANVISNGLASGTYGNAVTLNNSANQFNGTFGGNGGGLTNLNVATLGGLASSNFWQLGGNTISSGQFIGSLNSAPLDLYADGVRALRLILRTDSLGLYTNAPNVIGGSPVNQVIASVVGGTVSGGGGNDNNGISYLNQVRADFGTISGGVANNASGYAAFIGGGNFNTNSGYGATVSGGSFNLASSSWSVVGGGGTNTASGYAATVAGGNANTASGTGSFIGGGGYDGTTTAGNLVNSKAATIGGGLGNRIPSGAEYAFIGGGTYNTNSGYGSVIGGGGYDGTTVAGNTVNANAANIGGGLGNSIPGGAEYAFIGGGQYDIASGNSSTVTGGNGNTAGGNSSTVAGGYANTASADYAAVGGGFFNSASAIGSFIGGGGFGGGFNFGNTVNSEDAAIVGGVVNTIPSGAPDAFIGGGSGNRASGNSATVSGGNGNTASGDYATVAGGSGNAAKNQFATVGGGENNTASNYGATVGGGQANIASGFGATVPGGSGNTASGPGSFAAGTGAQANHDGSFVWADDNGFLNYSSTFANGFFARCTGGARFVTAIDNSGNPTAGVKLTPGDTAWGTISDRNAKKNFQPVDTVAVLNKLAAIPVEKWNYKWEADTNTPHLGPMAQDFKAAFYPGRDDKSISTLEFDGVELAAIQGLNQKVEEKDAKLQEQSADIADLKTRLEKLEKLMIEKLGGVK